MPDVPASPFPDTSFWHQYQARASGILNWGDLDAFWSEMKANPQGWFVFDPQTVPPQSAATAEEFKATLQAAQVLVNQRRDRSHSGAVYVDDRDAPTMIKVFDPVHMGTSCGCAGEQILPRYIFSIQKPDALPPPAEPKINTSLFRRLTGMR